MQWYYNNPLDDPIDTAPISRSFTYNQAILDSCEGYQKLINIQAFRKLRKIFTIKMNEESNESLKKYYRYRVEEETKNLLNAIERLKK